MALAAVPVGGSVSATVGGGPVSIARPNANSVVCFSAVCTHQRCTVDTGGGTLNCPCHGSQFNAFTGAVERGPAMKSLAAQAVHIQDGYVVAG